MSAEINQDPLSITIELRGDPPKTFRLDKSSNLQLAADLAVGLAASLHPHGTITRVQTAKSYVHDLRRLVRELEAEGFAGGAGELRRGQLAAFLLRSPASVESQVRRMLQAMERTQPKLKEEVRNLVFGRNFKPEPKKTPLQPYTAGEWDRLLDACRSEIRSSWRAHRDLVAAAAESGEPSEIGWSEASLAWLLSRLGHVSRETVAAHTGFRARKMDRLVNLPKVRSVLFPTVYTMTSYRLLLTAYTGIVPDGIDGLRTGDIDWAGRDTGVLNYVKGRTSAESLTLSPRAGRLLRQWLEHSEVMRRHAPATVADRLWLRANQRASLEIGFTQARGAVFRWWAERHQLLDDVGQPLRIVPARIRTTFIAQRQDRGWSGRSTIDPNHSPQVEGDRYLAVGTVAQQEAVDAIVIDAQQDLLRRAEPPIILTLDDTAARAEALPAEIARLKLAEGPLRELMSGEQDVFTAACADQYSGLHGPKGQPCPARPWVCLLCPLAVFAPRHLPNLLRLKAFFARQFQQMPREQFAAVFAAYADRLSSQVLPRFTEAAMANAAAQVADDDAELPLRAEETTGATNS